MNKCAEKCCLWRKDVPAESISTPVHIHIALSPVCVLWIKYNIKMSYHILLSHILQRRFPNKRMPAKTPHSTGYRSAAACWQQCARASSSMNPTTALTILKPLPALKAGWASEILPWCLASAKPQMIITNERKLRGQTFLCSCCAVLGVWGSNKVFSISCFLIVLYSHL